MRWGMVIGKCALLALLMLPAGAAASNKAKVKIDYFAEAAPQLPGPGTWYGSVVADKAKCGNDRKITLFQRDGDVNEKIGTDQSEEAPEDYAWDINDPAVSESNPYFAKMKKKGNCKKAKSKPFNYPEDQPPMWRAHERAAKAPTKVTIRRWTQTLPPNGEWTGRLSSDKAKCHKDRYIELFMRAGKENIAMGNTTATKDGQKWTWELPSASEPADGEYFVLVTPTPDCARAESKIFEYPDDNPPPR